MNWMRLSLVVIIISCLSYFLPLNASPDLVWFCPSDPDHYPSDFMNLFDTTYSSQWTAARGRVQVFKLYATLLPDKTDDELRAIFSYLAANNIALGIELAALTNSTTDSKGHGVEGYMSPGAAVSIVQRIKNLGGNLAYIALDEPLYFGHYYTGTNAVQDTVQNLAVNAANNLKQILALFPNAKIGDIEPIDMMPSDWQSTTQQWLAAYSSAMGRPFDFFHVDVIWTASWKSNIPALSTLLANNGASALGVIFNGTTAGTSNINWIESAETNIQTYNASGIVQPVHVIFQSWNGYPNQMLPESTSSSFTYLINYYFSAYATQAAPQTFYRLYNSGYQRHFYTINSTEASALQTSGWRLEGAAGMLYVGSASALGLQPLYRLYNSTTRDHLYTLSSTEKTQALASGYASEGVAGYMYPDANNGGSALYRAYSSSGGNFYTSSSSEYVSLSTNIWTKMGVIGYTP